MTQIALPVRHPLDPDVARSSKAGVVLTLGIVAALTGALVGGAIPATIALIIARAGRADLIASGGYLTGGRTIRTGVRLAWLGIILAAAAIVAAAIIGIFHLAASDGAPQHFAPGTD